MRGQRLQRCGGRVLGRVEEGDVADQRERALVGHRVDDLTGRQHLHRHGHHAQATVVEFARGLQHERERRGIERLVARAVALALAHVRAHREHFFERALADQLVVLVARAHHHRHAPARKVERDLVDLAVVLLELELGGQLDVLKHRVVEQVLQAGLVVAVEEGEVEHGLR